MEGPYKLLPAKQTRFGNLAGSAGKSLYGPSMSDFLGFQIKYIWNPWGISIHLVQLILLYLSTLLDSWLAHCAYSNCSKKSFLILISVGRRNEKAIKILQTFVLILGKFHGMLPKTGAMQ